MTGWSIQPDGVLTVLTAVQASAETYAGSFAGLETAQADLVAGVGTDVLLPCASTAADLLDSKATVVAAANARILACANGAAAATTAYVAGDEEMAARTQADAVTVAGSPDLLMAQGTS